MGPDMVPQLLGLVLENFVSSAVLVEVMPVLEPAGAWFGRHVENFGDVIIYPVLVVAWAAQVS